MTTDNLLDHVKTRLNLRTDVQLSFASGITPQQISKMRVGTLVLGPAHLIRLHELTGLPTLELKRLMALEECPRCGEVFAPGTKHAC